MIPKKIGRKGLISGATFPNIPAGKGPGGGKISAAMTHSDKGEQASDQQAANGPAYSSPPSQSTGVGGMRGAEASAIMGAHNVVRPGTSKSPPTDHGVRRTVSTPRQEGNPSQGASRTQTAQARVRAGTGRPASDKDVSVGPKIRGNTMRSANPGAAEKARKYAATGTQIPDSMEEGRGGVIRAAKGGHVKAAFGGLGGMAGRISRPIARPQPMPMRRPMPMRGAMPGRGPMAGGVAPAPGAAGMSVGMPRPAGGGFRPAMAKGGRVPMGMGQMAKLDAKLDKKLGKRDAS